MSKIERCWKCSTPVVFIPGIGEYCANKQCDVGDALDLDKVAPDHPVRFSGKQPSEAEDMDTFDVALSKAVTEALKKAE